MKKIITYISTALILTFGFVSCDEDETVYNPLQYPQDAYIAIEGSGLAVLEGSTAPIEIVANYSNDINAATSEVVVDFSITSDNGIEGTHYTVVDGKTQFKFAPGVFTDKVTIIPINNFDEDGDKELTITLDNSSVNLGAPGPDSFGTTFNLTLLDDDCAIVFEELVGPWTGFDNSSGSEGPNASQIVSSYDGTTFYLEGIAYGWLTNTSYWDEVVVVSNPVIANIDVLTGVVTIDEQFLCTTTWLGDIQPDYSISATGQYLACSSEMILDYTLYQSGGIRRQYTETIKFE